MNTANKSPNLIRDYQQLSVSSGGPDSKLQLNSVRLFIVLESECSSCGTIFIHMVGLKSTVSAETSSGRNEPICP